jgi:hypothetical protein
LLKGVELNGRSYRNHIDGYNLLDYLSGKAADSPRSEFIYTNGAGEIVAMRVGAWKAVYLENRARQLDVLREPFVQLRLPLLFNLRRDPFERAFVLGPMQVVTGRFLMTFKDYPPSQTPGDWSLQTLERQMRRMTAEGG